MGVGDDFLEVVVFYYCDVVGFCCGFEGNLGVLGCIVLCWVYSDDEGEFFFVVVYVNWF